MEALQKFRDAGAIPGEWRFLDAFPETVFTPPDRLYLRPTPGAPANAAALSMDPAPGRGGTLSELSGEPSALKLSSITRAAAGSTDSFGPDGDEGFYGLDARAENVYGLCFDTPPLRTSLEILGFAQAHLYVSATAPLANWMVQLYDLCAGRHLLPGDARVPQRHTSPFPLSSGAAGSQRDLCDRRAAHVYRVSVLAGPTW